MTKEQLRAYRDIKLEYDRLVVMRQEQELIIFSPPAPQLTGMPHAGASNGSPVERAAEKHAELLKTYRQKEAELLEALQVIEQAIESLPPIERTVIRLYYARGLTWEQVCVEIGYSWSQTHRIHAAALERLREGETDV